MPRHVFRYKFIGGQHTPIITIGIHLDATWYPVEVYVDSGAAYTVLHARFAEGAGFDYRKGQRIYIQVGDGSLIPVYLHDLELQIGTERLVAKVGFSDRLGIAFNLLGRKDIFDHFAICFHERQRILTFET